MLEIGVGVAVMQNGKLLLTQREDFEVWCLPGGAVEDQEAIADAARREVFEETGLEIRLTRLVGLYSHPNWGQGGVHAVILAAVPVGGSLTLNPHEVIQADFFSPEDLPKPLIKDHLQIIADVFKGEAGFVRTYCQDWPFEPSVDRWQIYAMREASGLSRSDFYLKYWAKDNPDESRDEIVPGYKLTSSSGSALS